MVKKWVIGFSFIFFVITVGYASDRETYLHVLTSLEAPVLGQRTTVEFSSLTKEKLNATASIILTYLAQDPSKNILHISNPLLHRTLCSFATRFVYEVEKNNLSQDIQVYVVLEESTAREEGLKLEAQHLQNLFNRCYHSEITVAQSGLYFFAWDESAYLNQVLVALQETTSSQEIPDIFKNDPVLSKIYAVHQSPLKKHVVEEMGDEAVNIMLTGVKEELHETANVDMGEVTKSVINRMTTQARKQIGEQIWKRRQALVHTFTKDDTNLFTLKDAQEDTARRLTNLIALPGKSKVSEGSFSDKLKNILGDDAKVKFNVGKDKIYAGFKIKFK